MTLVYILVVAKRKTPKYLRKVQKIIDKNCRKTITANANYFTVSMHSIGRIVHKDLRYMSYVMRKGKFMPMMTKAIRLIRAKLLLSKLKYHVFGMLFFLSLMRKKL